MKSSKTDASARNAATFIAMLALLATAFGLLGLAAMVMPQILGLLVVVGGFGFCVLFHYLVWGWWLSGRAARLQPEETD